MTRTTCARARELVQFYLDDQLSQKQAEDLQRHLSGCAACREELSALLRLRHTIVATDPTPQIMPEGEPADLTEAIMRRVAAYEVSKAQQAEARAEGLARRRAALERRPEFIPDFVPGWVGWRSVGVSAVMVALLITALLPGGWGAMANTLAHQLDGMVSALLSPGPDQISWAVWLAGGLVTLAAFVWFMRADASSQWRRAISERLPPLW
jgi:anti-sigma factor RsiW